MDISHFSTKWFLVYYTAMGVGFLTAGIALILHRKRMEERMIAILKLDKPPTFIRTLLKYFFIFTLPSLVLSFIPFSWVELLFSIWSLIVVYVVGIRLVRWKQTKIFLQNYRLTLGTMIQYAGLIFISVGLVMVLLLYLVIGRIF